jgi:hypothetical protein
MPQPEIDRPIFIVGCPRSGTTALYSRMATHPDLAWISNITKKVPDSLLLTRLVMLVRHDHHPTEAKNVWRRYATADHDARGRDDATPRARAFLHKVIRNQLRIWHKPRFLSKCPRNSVRIPFLDAVFPGAFFMHIVRDGRAVANSLMRAREKHGGRYWACEPPGWQEIAQRPMLESCALQWRRIVERALDDAAELPAERYVEVRYEDFCERPAEVFRHISNRVGIEWDDVTLAELVSDVESRNYKWRESLTADQVATLNRLQGDLLERLGYEP